MRFSLECRDPAIVDESTTIITQQSFGIVLI